MNKAAKARLKQALQINLELTSCLIEFERSKDHSKMPHIRTLVNKLTQCVHEYNAYSNSEE